MQLWPVAAALLLVSSAAADSAMSSLNQQIELERHTIDTTSTPEWFQVPHPLRRFTHLSVDERLADETPFTFYVHVNDLAVMDDIARALANGDHHETMKAWFPTYVPHNTFVVHAPHSVMKSIKHHHSGVRWIGLVQPDHKRCSSLDLSPDELQRDSGEPLNVPLPLHRELSTRYVLQLSMNSTYGLIATLVPHNRPHTSEELRTIASRLLNEMHVLEPDPLHVILVTDLDARLNPRPAIMWMVPNQNGDQRIRIELQDEFDLQRAADVLINDIDVIYVERHLPVHLTNRWARGVVQNGLTSAADYSLRRGVLAWDRGLLGQGQIIGVADSGLDPNNCLLTNQISGSSATNLIPYRSHHGNPRSPSDSPSSTDATLRKVVQYVTFADSADDLSGHGTHVSAIASGSPPSTGSVPLGLSEYSGMAPGAQLAFFDIGHSRGNLEVPDDLTNPFLEWAYVAGARIHSNSWGANVNLYTSQARDFDTFLWNRQDFIALVAIGNQGSCNEPGTIGSPATAKNVITVGASFTTLDSYASQRISPSPLYSSDPSKFNENNIPWFSSRGPTRDGRIKPDVIAPGFATLSAQSGKAPNTCKRSLTEIIDRKSGTSMATPAVAGALAIIRQYLTAGYFPTGIARDTDKFTPSGALLKAILINSATSLPASATPLLEPDPDACPNAQQGFHSVADRPGIDQGWGRVELDTGLDFNDASINPIQPGRRFYTHLMGRGPMQQASDLSPFGDPQFSLSGQQHSYELCIIPGAPVVNIVLVWTDPPAMLGSATQLVNNLDLVVVLNETDAFLGNARSSQDIADYLNPVETVFLYEPVSLDAAPVKLEVRVLAQRIVKGPQPYALVVQGMVRHANCADLVFPHTNQSVAPGPPDGKGDLLPIRVIPKDYPRGSTTPPSDKGVPRVGEIVFGRDGKGILGIGGVASTLLVAFIIAAALACIIVFVKCRHSALAATIQQRHASARRHRNRQLPAETTSHAGIPGGSNIASSQWITPNNHAFFSPRAGDAGRF